MKNIKKIVAITLFLSLAFVGFAQAQNATSTADDLPDPGILPGHPLYFVKSITESVGLALAFGNTNKAERLSDIAERRLAEARVLVDEGDNQRAERALERYQERINSAVNRAEQAKEEGDDKAEDVISRITEATARHQSVLADVYEKVPEEAREAISMAMEVSKRGHNQALSAISGEKKDEIQSRIDEFKAEANEKLNDLRQRGINIPDVSIPSDTADIPAPGEGIEGPDSNPGNGGPQN